MIAEVVIVAGGQQLAATNALLIQGIEFAMDISVSREEEVSVLHRGMKVAGFTRGLRTFPHPVPRPSFPTQDEIVMAAIEATGGHVGRAAKLAGFSRTTFYRRLSLLRAEGRA